MFKPDSCKFDHIFCIFALFDSGKGLQRKTIFHKKFFFLFVSYAPSLQSKEKSPNIRRDRLAGGPLWGLTCKSPEYLSIRSQIYGDGKSGKSLNAQKSKRFGLKVWNTPNCLELSIHVSFINELSRYKRIPKLFQDVVFHQ